MSVWVFEVYQTLEVIIAYTTSYTLFLQTDPLLDNIERLLDDTRQILDSLNSRLQVLEEQIEQNQADLEVARNLTREATDLADQVNDVGLAKPHYYPTILYIEHNITCALLVVQYLKY